MYRIRPSVRFFSARMRVLLGCSMYGTRPSVRLWRSAADCSASAAIGTEQGKASTAVPRRRVPLKTAVPRRRVPLKKAVPGRCVSPKTVAPALCAAQSRCGRAGKRRSFPRESIQKLLLRRCGFVNVGEIGPAYANLCNLPDTNPEKCAIIPKAERQKAHRSGARPPHGTRQRERRVPMAGKPPGERKVPYGKTDQYSKF